MRTLAVLLGVDSIDFQKLSVKLSSTKLLKLKKTFLFESFYDYDCNVCLTTML